MNFTLKSQEMAIPDFENQNGLLFFGVVEYVCLQRKESSADPELCLQNDHKIQEV
jgi:hypothetical protein